MLLSSFVIFHCLESSSLPRLESWLLTLARVNGVFCDCQSLLKWTNESVPISKEGRGACSLSYLQLKCLFLENPHVDFDKILG